MINGPCGAGKSSAARALRNTLDNSELLSIDEMRRTISEPLFDDPLGRPEDAARMWQVNVVARQLASKALMNGQTVIVDSIKYQTDWVKPWEDLGHRLGISVLDVCVMASKPTVQERVRERDRESGGRLTPEKVSTLYDKVVSFYSDRSKAIVLNSEMMNEWEVAGEIEDLLLR